VREDSQTRRSRAGRINSEKLCLLDKRRRRTISIQSILAFHFHNSLCPDEAEQKRQRKSDEKTKKQEDPMCKHHGDMVPEFENLKNLKTFELKSDCNKFHWISEGHDQ
jgi:hypothetical protein